MSDGPGLREASRPIPAIFLGGLLAGALDLTYAIVVYSPQRPLLIPQAIAAGIYGRHSFQLGWQSILVGTLCHFAIALGAAVTYYLASRKLPVMIHRPVLCGLIFGALVYVFMHTVVLPLSAAPPSHARLFVRACEFVWHWFGVGLPISLSARRYSG